VNPDPTTIITFSETSAGCRRGTFTDAYGSSCAIQEGSTTEDCRLWLGVEKSRSGATSSRMHLTRGMAATLIPLLQEFVATGTLPKEWQHVGGVAPSAPVQSAMSINCGSDEDSDDHEATAWTFGHVRGVLLQEFRRWNEPDPKGDTDALKGELATALQLGAIGAISNVLAALVLPHRPDVAESVAVFGGGDPIHLAADREPSVESTHENPHDGP
jgi:hypothetical protein